MNDPRAEQPQAAATRRSPHLPALLSLGLMVGTINGLSRVAMPLFAASRGAQPGRWASSAAWATSVCC